MNKIVTKIFSLLLAFTFIFNIFSTTVYASSNNDISVDVKNESYYKNKVSQNKYVQERVKDLENENFHIDKNIKSIEDVDFIYYYNNDKSIVGLIQLNAKLNSEIRVNSIDSNPVSIEFIKENGNRMEIGKDKDGKFTEILYHSPEYTSYDVASWCPYVIGLAGLPISSLYTYIAGLIGGPLAAVIVAGISNVGWSYVTSQC